VLDQVLSLFIDLEEYLLEFLGVVLIFGK